MPFSALLSVAFRFHGLVQESIGGDVEINDAPWQYIWQIHDGHQVGVSQILVYHIYLQCWKHQTFSENLLVVHLGNTRRVIPLGKWKLTAIEECLPEMILGSTRSCYPALLPEAKGFDHQA